MTHAMQGNGMKLNGKFRKFKSGKSGEDNEMWHQAQS